MFIFFKFDFIRLKIYYYIYYFKNYISIFITLRIFGKTKKLLLHLKNLFILNINV